MKQQLTKQEVEEKLIKAIFGDTPLKKCDCDDCLLRTKCEIDNPDFNANYCKVS